MEGGVDGYHPSTQTALSIVAIVLSAMSLGWQAATFALIGGRVRAELRPGGVYDAGAGLVTIRVDKASQNWRHQIR
ncbi:hypothetical protein [Amycolatopsis sp. NPDC059021]|uniref:hypothetical protein n=1 Tax=Amycolatopsis sp. NPDC059021 TaxID=3346704 RepID=UPI00366D5312